MCVLRYIPRFICGDLDSAREEVLDFYKKKVSVVVVCSHLYIPLVGYWYQYFFHTCRERPLSDCQIKTQPTSSRLHSIC